MLSTREQDLLEKYLVRNTTDIPLHERFYKLSQIHSQRSSGRKSHSIAPDEVRIQIRPFSTNPMMTSRRSNPAPIPASNFRSDRMTSARPRPTTSASKISQKRSKTRGTMAMDRKPMSLSERMSRLSPLRDSIRPGKSPKSSPTAISESSKIKKRKVKQRLAVQARLGQNNQKLSAKDRLAKAVGVLNVRKPPVVSRISANQKRPQFRNNKGSSNRQFSKVNKSKYSLNNKKSSGKAGGGKPQTKQQPNAMDLDKELDEFMKAKWFSYY